VNKKERDNVKSKYIWLSISCILLMIIIAVEWNSKLVEEALSGLTKYELNEKYYLNYEYRSVGIVPPRINSIVLLDENYKQISNKNDYFDYEFYINEGIKVGAPNEDYIYTEPEKLAYRKKAKGYKVDNKNLRIVLGINFHKNIPETFSPYIKISYSILGIRKNIKIKICLIKTSQTAQ
jgi:hypothetical protein